MGNHETEVLVRMVLSSWDSYNARVTKLLGDLSDDQLMSETAPGRNRGIYLIGHLTAVTDGLFKLMGLGDRLYPDMEEIFVKNPDRAATVLPPIAEVRSRWNAVCAEFTKRIGGLTVAEWFGRHTAVSAEDFAKEPHRNKLNLIVNRTSHTAYHLGQLVYLEKK